MGPTLANMATRIPGSFYLAPCLYFLHDNVFYLSFLFALSRAIVHAALSLCLYIFFSTLKPSMLRWVRKGNMEPKGSHRASINVSAAVDIARRPGILFWQKYPGKRQLAGVPNYYIDRLKLMFQCLKFCLKRNELAEKEQYVQSIELVQLDSTRDFHWRRRSRYVAVC